VDAAVTRAGGPELPGLLPSALLGAANEAEPGPRSTRDWIVDVTVFVLAAGAGLMLLFLQPDVETAPGGLVLADLVAGAALCVALWWRRTFPVQVAVAAAVLGTFAASAGAPALVALFTVALHRRSRVVAVVAALHVVSGITFVVARPDHDIPMWLGALIAALFVAVAVAWGMFARARRQLVVSLAERARRAETEQQLRVEQAQATERTRIAREMHDVLAHRISLVSLHAGALEFHPDAQPAEVASAAAVIRSTAHQALQDLRDILGVLRAGVADGDGERPQPTLVDLPRLVDESRAAGATVACTCSVAEPETVPGPVGRTVYRVVQEGLTNARKHAAGTTVSVSVDGRPGPGVSIEVGNPRPVGALARPGIPGAGRGLVGLAERVALVGGRIEHGRLDDGSWRLRAWLPWDPAPEPGERPKDDHR
jgi:signal transduction histidine kinase